MYFNSVAKSHKATQKTESVTEQEDVCQVNQPQTQNADTSAENIGATEGHYERLHISTTRSLNTNHMNTYAELQ